MNRKNDNSGGYLDKKKKMKAALVGVIYYLLEKERELNLTQSSHWVRSGREIIMRNRMLVQRRGIRR